VVIAFSADYVGIRTTQLDATLRQNENPAHEEPGDLSLTL
jgi:hypothetical protein